MRVAIFSTPTLQIFNNRRLFLLLPVTLFLSIFFIYPLVTLVWMSISGSEGLSIYIRLLSMPLYLRVMFNTIKIASVVTLICLFFSYPFCLLLTKISLKMKSIMLFLVMLPLWTSLLVRNYAWMLLLERKGAINYFLLKLGIIDTPLRLIYNETGVIIGMVYIMLPFMILPLFGSVNSFDKMLLHAADSLGARPLQIFLFVYIPLTLPGIAAGSVLVFMLSLGFFITPAMLGGAREMMMAVRINEEAVHLLHWDVASALALILLIVTMLLFFVGMRWFGFRKIWEGLS